MSAPGRQQGFSSPQRLWYVKGKSLYQKLFLRKFSCKEICINLALLQYFLSWRIRYSLNSSTFLPSWSDSSRFMFPEFKHLLKRRRFDDVLEVDCKRGIGKALQKLHIVVINDTQVLSSDVVKWNYSAIFTALLFFIKWHNSLTNYS